MATLFLLVGLPGSGKTTLARQLERERSALVLSADEWMDRIVGDGWDADRRAAVQAVQWDVAARALALGIDVVLDFGCIFRRERDHYRASAAAIGARTLVCFLDAPREELLRRLAARDADPPPHTFRVDAEHLDRCIGWFEPPTADELE